MAIARRCRRCPQNELNPNHAIARGLARPRVRWRRGESGGLAARRMAMGGKACLPHRSLGRGPAAGLLWWAAASYEPRPRHRAYHPRRLRQALPALPRDERAVEAALRAGRLGRGARGVEGAHPDVRPARQRGRRHPARALPPGRPRRDAVAGDQGGLHRPPARAPAARVRRDLLQLGRMPRARPPVLPARVHLLAARGLHRAPRRRRAHLPLLLPDEGRPPEHRPLDS